MVNNNFNCNYDNNLACCWLIPLYYYRYSGGSWQRLADLNVARGSLVAALACGRLYCFGGGKPKEQYNVVEW